MNDWPAADSKPTRRSFINEFIFGWLLLMIAPVVYTIFEYLTPPNKEEGRGEILPGGTVSDLMKAGSSRRIKVGKKPVFLILDNSGQIRAYSGICTHLGCVVEYKADVHQFHCNCHGSVFDRYGKNVYGPATRPLDAFKVSVKGNDIGLLKIEQRVM